MISASVNHSPISKRSRNPLRLLLLTGLAALSALPARADALFSTYLGGRNYDGAYAVAVDSTGNIFIGGSTSSTNTFPVLDAWQSDYAGGYADAFLAKFDPEGHLLFSTFFGGTGYDAVNDLAIDPQGNLLVVGETRSVDLPTTQDAFQPDYAGGSAFGYGDGFIAKFSPDGTQLLYCSYFGGSGDEKIGWMALSGDGSLYITGQTDSKNLLLRTPFQPQYGGGESDGFIARFDSTLTNLVYSSYFGGENRDEDQRIALDPNGHIYVCGQTLSTNFPVTAGAFQTNHIVVEQVGENWDAFVTKFAPDGSKLVYSTYLGDATADAAFGIAADSNGCAYVTGAISASWDDGTFPPGFQPTPGYGYLDAWVAKLKPDGSNFEWFSYLGGGGQGIFDSQGQDAAYDLVLDRDNNVYVTGITESTNFPTAQPLQAKYGGGIQDSFVAKISADGQKLLYSTYLGGSEEEWGYRVAVDSLGNIIAIGQSPSTNFPVYAAVQPTNALARVADAYVTKLAPPVEAPALSIALSGTNVILSWPTNFIEFRLETTPALAPSTAWKPLTNAPTTVGNRFVVVQPVAGTACYHRLRTQ